MCGEPHSLALYLLSASEKCEPTISAVSATRANTRKARDVIAKACARATSGMQIARRLEVACGTSEATALAVADKIAACNRCDNTWTGEDLHNADGELYEATGTLWACYERLCPSCAVARSRRARKSAREAIARPIPSKDKRERYWFVTLTMPTLPAAQVSLLQTLQVVRRAWRLFSQLGWWQAKVRAGVKGAEFTLGDRYRREQRAWSPALDGFHVHLHLLILSPWLNGHVLREKWTNALLTAWEEVGIYHDINTRDGLAVCHLKPVTQANCEGVLSEVAKYITKSESWLSIPDEQLVEIASVERWPRMFELLGECRAAASRSSAATSAIGEGADACRRISFEERIEALEQGGSLEDAQLALEARWELYALHKVNLETRAAVEARTRYLDTNDVSAGNDARDGPTRRAQTLKAFGEELIKRGERQKFREMLSARVCDVQEFRRVQQSRQYPFAKFSTLDGRTWFGLRASPRVGA